MVGWYHQLSGHEFEQILGDAEGQGSLACCSPWGHKESDTTNNTVTYPSIPTRRVPWAEGPEGYSPWWCKELGMTEATEHAQTCTPHTVWFHTYETSREQVTGSLGRCSLKGMGFLFEMMQRSKTDQWWLCISVNILKSIKLHILNGWIIACDIYLNEACFLSWWLKPCPEGFQFLFMPPHHLALGLHHFTEFWEWFCEVWTTVLP